MNALDVVSGTFVTRATFSLKQFLPFPYTFTVL
jgi:hypothetical protein